MSSSTGNCSNCNECLQCTGWICRLDGNFYSTGEYSRTIDFFGIHGVSFNQRLDSVKMQLDSNTIQILKVLLTDNDAPVDIDYPTGLDIIQLLNFIQSKLSNDNTNSFVGGDEQ